MFFEAPFWVVLAAAFAALRLGPDGVRWRAGVFAATGLAGLIWVLAIALREAAVLGVSVAALTAGACLLSRSPRMGLALIAVAPIGFAWVLGKAGMAFGVAGAAPLLFVGISYMLVKGWSLFKDLLDGKVREANPLEVLAYFLHLPTVALGPMHQFTEFRAGLETPWRMDAERLIDCVFRFTLGLFKVYVVAGLLAPASLIGLAGEAHIPIDRLILGAFLYSIVLYADFSGFCDMAIATSRLLGMDVPENFHWPYLASSMREFWRRWHITFSRALTAHVFMPLSRVLGRRMPGQPGRVAALCYVLTFAFCGYWHGATANFVIWGLWHALGLVVQDAWARRQRARGIRPVVPKPFISKPWGMALTFSFVSLGWVFFVLPVEALGRIGGAP